jgi:hypothetical protein
MTPLHDDAQRAHIEDALAAYPNISKERLAALIAWFRKEASALDVALIASNAAIEEPYRRFRADHIDGLSGVDMIKGSLIAASVIGGFILYIVLMAP